MVDNHKDPEPKPEAHDETKKPWKGKESDPIAIPRKNVDKRKDLLERMKGIKPKP